MKKLLLMAVVCAAALICCSSDTTQIIKEIESEGQRIQRKIVPTYKSLR